MPTEEMLMEELRRLATVGSDLWLDRLLEAWLGVGDLTFLRRPDCPPDVADLAPERWLEAYDLTVGERPPLAVVDVKLWREPEVYEVTVGEMLGVGDAAAWEWDTRWSTKGGRHSSPSL